MSTALMTRHAPKPMTSLAPTSFNEAIQFAEMLSKSNLVPQAYKHKPQDVLVAMQMGFEVNLQPMQALQNIAVINGKPTVWGDAALAICQSHPSWKGHLELSSKQVERLEKRVDSGSYEPDPLERAIIAKSCPEDGGAVCCVWRDGENPHVVQFSRDDAKNAGLLGRKGPWTQYESRMFQMRARGFALRDKFADALKGLITAEEAQDYQQIVQNSHYQTTEAAAPALPDGSREAKVSKIMSHFASKDIPKGKVLEYVGRESENDITVDDIEKLRAYARSLGSNGKPPAVAEPLPEPAPEPAAIESQTAKLKAMLAAKSAKS